MTKERLQKRLEAAGDETAHDGTLSPDLADPGCPLDAPYRGCAYKGDFDLLLGVLWVHGRQRTEQTERCHQWNDGISTEATGGPVSVESRTVRSVARPTQRSGNLPAEATSFIGRRHELADARKKLTAARLVSLVGPGGVGKTRLAIRIRVRSRTRIPGRCLAGRARRAL